MPEEFLTPGDAARYLKRLFGIGAERWLSKLRSIGGGPIYRRFGKRILYNEQDLYNWATARVGEAQRSTSKGGGQLVRGSSRKACPQIKAAPNAGRPDNTSILETDSFLTFSSSYRNRRPPHPGGTQCHFPGHLHRAQRPDRCSRRRLLGCRRNPARQASAAPGTVGLSDSRRSS